MYPTTKSLYNKNTSDELVRSTSVSYIFEIIPEIRQVTDRGCAFCRLVDLPF